MRDKEAAKEAQAPVSQQKLDELKESWKTFSSHPGVYLMRDRHEKVIYVGKAKNLKNRLASYLRGGDGRQQIPFLMRRVNKIETIVTDNEQQAYVLERDLIAKYHPRYNVKLKDDKSFLSIRIDENQAWPRLELVRRVEGDGARYFGPYSFSYELRALLEMINKAIPLRSCNNTIFYNRQRPCLEYQIKRCAGPCCLDVDRKQYALWVKEAIAILEGRTADLEKDLTKQMEKASEDLRFEDAAAIRDRIEIIKNFKQGGTYISAGAEDRDVFALYREERLAVISLMKVRNGRISDNNNYTFSNVEIADDEVLEAVISQYYDGERDLAPEIVLPFELDNISLLREGIATRYEVAPTFTLPKIGLKKRLLGLAALNARQHYIFVFDADSRYKEAATALAKILKLSQIPRRIECVDISNLQASDIVGGIVSFYDGVPDKKNYKKYIITKQDKPDDFGSIYEVITRRLKHAMEDDEDQVPDLFLIDGGRGQLGAALAARDDLGVTCEIASLAKIRATKGKKLNSEDRLKPERIFREGVEEAIPLDPSADSTLLVTRIRDEAHRHVIQFHRSRRSKRVFSSVLDDIPGIGSKRKTALIAAFGGVNGMKQASIDELMEKGHLPKVLAEKLMQKLHNLQ